MPHVAGELYLDCGKSFWKIQQERMAEVRVWRQELQRALQVSNPGLGPRIHAACLAIPHVNRNTMQVLLRPS